MKYRSEIDGLRALAVLPVILFHAGFSLFSGGFIGVDVFFVISGYLITQIILEDISRGTFSIARFYERRARRILPALFFVILVTIPIAFCWMLPSQYEAYSRSLIAVVLFISNLFFWRESGYFAAEASEKPLLHTWSLGVEEQYYVLFPLALLILWRFGKQHAWIGVALMALISFGLCEYASRYYHSANFFLLPTRAWELFVGSLCAFAHMHSAPKKQNLLAAIGLGLILLAVFTYSEHMRLPSAYTLAPVLGTALILLFSAGGTWVSRLLSLRLVVGVGLISYSAYLWHHPLFAFARIHSFTTPATTTMLLLAALSLVLGALSWWLVEQPFRNKQHRHYVKNRPALALACIGALAILAVGSLGHFTQGHLQHWKENAPQNQVRAFELLDTERDRAFEFDNGDCLFNLNELATPEQERLIACSRKYGEGIAVIGDSHAMNLFHVLKHRAKERPFIVGMAQGMCRPNAPLATCNYAPLLTLLEQHPDIFGDVIYEQAGWHLFTDRHGREITQDALSGLPLDAPVPVLAPNMQHIVAVEAYLAKLAKHAKVTWLGARIEPEIAESVIVHLGCDYPFRLRPNQQEAFAQLDDAISAQLAKSTVKFQSQMALMGFDMAHDFMNCDVTYWKDRNHYSAEGEKRFGERITLERIMP